MAYRSSVQNRGAALGNAVGLAGHSQHRAGKLGISKLARIRELEAEVKQLTKERNALREALTRLQNSSPPTTPVR